MFFIKSSILAREVTLKLLLQLRPKCNVLCHCFFKQIQTSLFYHLDSATESSKSLKLGQPFSKAK